MSLNGARRSDSLPAPTERRILESANGVLSLGVPSNLIEAIAERTADLLAQRVPDQPEPYLNVEQAAEYLAATTDRIYDLRRQGLPAFKDGTRLLFRRDDLDDWLTRTGTA
jgi:excisionase family DNA binding protein